MAREFVSSYKRIIGGDEYTYSVDSEGNEWVGLSDNDNITAHDYPKLNTNKAHEYVVGAIEKGNGKANKTAVKYYQQNGYKYDGKGKRIIGTGKHVKQKPR